MHKKTRYTVVAALLLISTLAHAAWNADWKQRKKVTVDTTEAGGKLKAELAQVPVLMRLHTGKFAFLDAKPDGSDLRVIADDDKTPLKFHIETYDSTNELALVWVQLPKLAANSKTDGVWLYYGNDKAPAAGDPKGTYDANQTAVLHFAEKDGLPQDSTAYANNATASNAKGGVTGPIGGAIALDGTNGLRLPASPSLKLAAGGGFTFSAWVKSSGPQAGASLFRQVENGKGIVVGVDGDAVYAQVLGGPKPVETPRSAKLAAGKWQHVAVTVGDRVVVYVDGVEAAAVAASLPEAGGEPVIGADASAKGFVGELDEVSLAKVARTADWIRLAAASQGPDAALLKFGEDEDANGGGSSYISILLGAVTLDGWVVIGILMVMAVISVYVMFAKSVMVVRVSRANRRFREKFATHAELDGLAGAAEDAFGDSTLFRVYRVGVAEARNRLDNRKDRILSSQSISAIKASIDAGMVRENERLNSSMVLLTIAISGGPFLGLLGTVVGVMITFAAIAAAGDVNVNSIAPGIAAALVATVAGLGVAIPALFGYNWLASKNKEISNDTAVFADELVTRLAEDYSS